MSRPLQSAQWLETIDAFIAGRLDPAASSQFQERLRNDEEARLVYVEYLDLHFELLQGAGRLADAESVARQASAPRYGKLAAAGAAAALIALVAWGLFQQADQRQVVLDALPVVVPQAAPTVLPPPEPEPLPPFAATLVRSLDARWTDSDVIPEEQSRLRVGDVLDFTAGVIELQFDSGARTCLVAGEGRTALLRLTSANSCRLESGHATFAVPAQAHGFTVETSGGRFVDHGTEFGVAADPRGPSQVHVIEGRVEASSRQFSTSLMLSKGSAAALDGSGSAVVPVAFQPDDFLRPTTLSWGVEHYSESILPHLIPPASVERSADLPQQFAHLVLEKRGMSLGSDWLNGSRNAFLLSASGRAEVNSFSVPAGTRVDSYLFHAAPSAVGRRRDVAGEIRFRRPIVAVITETDDLRRGMDQFANQDVRYADEAGFGLETTIGRDANDRVDVVELSEDRMTMKFVLNLGNAIDQIRVLVAADAPAPGRPVDAEEQK